MAEGPKLENVPEEVGTAGELGPILQKRRLLTEGERSEVRSAVADIVGDETAALRKELEVHRQQLQQHRQDLEFAQRRAYDGERRASRGKNVISKLENLWLDAPPEIQERLHQVMMESQMTPRGEMESPRRSMESPRRSISSNLQPTPEDREVTNGLPHFAPRPRPQGGTPSCLNSEPVSGLPPAGPSGSANYPETNASKPPGMKALPLNLIQGSALQSQAPQAPQDKRPSLGGTTTEHNIGSSSEDGSSDSDASEKEVKQDPIGTITVSPEHYQQMLHSARDADKAKADLEMRMQMLKNQDKGVSPSNSQGATEEPSQALQRLDEALAREADARADLERALAGLSEEQAWHGLHFPRGVLAAPLLLSGPGRTTSVGGGSPDRLVPPNRLADLSSPQTVWWHGNTPSRDAAVSA